jgi:hypothetical protein
LLSLLGPFIKDVRAHGGIKGMLADVHPPHFSGMQIFPIFMICLVSVMLFQAVQWNFDAKVIPMIVAIGALFFCSLSLLNDLFKSQAVKKAVNIEDKAKAEIQKKIHMDIGSNITHLGTLHIITRGAIFFGWMLFFLTSMATIGLIPTVPIFVVSFMRVEAREPWKIVLVYAAFMTVFIYAVFDQLLTIPWPPTILGDLIPALKGVIPSV